MAELRLRSPRAYRLVSAPVSWACDGDRSGSRAPIPSLSRAIVPDVVRPLIAERNEAYFAILVALSAAHRDGADPPTLDELRRRVALGEEDEAAFLRDLLQLEAWSCVKRELEPSRVRGYSDARRDRFRHRLTDDAAAFLGWLEARADEQRRERRGDTRECFTDVTARITELTGIVSAPAEEPGAARRAQHLVRSVDAELEGIERALSRLDAELRAFAERGFEPSRLTRIVEGLEAFLEEHVATVEPARAALARAIATLREAGFAARWSGWSGLAPSFAATPTERRMAPPRADEGDARIAGWERRIAVDGAIDRLARRVEEGTRASIAALRRHVRSLVEESRATGATLDRAIRLLAMHEEGTPEIFLALWGQGGPTWAPGSGESLAPPLPRRRARAATIEPIELLARPDAERRPTAEPTPDARRRFARVARARRGAWRGRVALCARGIEPS